MSDEVARLNKKIKNLKSKVNLLEDIVENTARNLFLKNEELEKKQNQVDLVASICETDCEGVLTYVNDNFCRFSGYSKNELIGSTFSIINSNIHPREFWEELWKKIKTKQVWKGEICNKSRNGDFYWVETTITSIQDNKGQTTGYSSIRIDITDKKIQAQKELKHTSKLASIGQLAAGVGHEINNPLAISVGNITLLKKCLLKEEIKNPKVMNYIEKTEIANDRIRRIVDGLRIYARSDKDELEVINIGEAIDETLNLISEIYGKDNIKIKKTSFDSHCFMRGSSGELSQIFMNLISNAKDATEGQLKREIHIELSHFENDQIKVSITDNGTGIPDEIKEEILKPFFTTNEIGVGTGMGLSLVHELIKKMSGRLEIRSKIGKGSSFTILFPAIISDKLEVKNSQKDEVFKFSGEKILIVDDEKDIRLLLKDYLENMDLIVDLADCGHSALAKLKKNKYDYILTDMQMPHMSGVDFIKRACKLPNGDCYYFTFTGGVVDFVQDDEEIVIHGQIKKPFTEKSLYKLISSVRSK